MNRSATNIAINRRNASIEYNDALILPHPANPAGSKFREPQGAYADLVIVDGNPLEDISLLADPEANLKVIMKDGKIYKNTLERLRRSTAEPI